MELSHESHSNADPSLHAEGQIKQQILFQISEQAFQKHQPLMFLLSTTASTTAFAPSLPHQTRFLEDRLKGPKNGGGQGGGDFKMPRNTFISFTARTTILAI